MNATARHYCDRCQVAYRTSDVLNVAGREFRVDGNIMVLVATAPGNATPGQDEPSGQCPKCGGPVYCAEFHPS